MKKLESGLTVVAIVSALPFLVAILPVPSDRAAVLARSTGAGLVWGCPSSPTSWTSTADRFGSRVFPAWAAPSPCGCRCSLSSLSPRSIILLPISPRLPLFASKLYRDFIPDVLYFERLRSQPFETD